MIDDHGPATIVKELVRYSLGYPSSGPGGKGMLKRQSKEFPDTSISGLAASIASKLARTPPRLAIHHTPGLPY